ncbi:MAG: Abi family protein [Clostridia bacterium]|nr:Abi family protein [Clostridia bacterium]
MKREYTIINKQIEELKSKGLKFKNEQQSKEIILRENYYFLINGYEEVFLNLKKESNSYEEETYFEELYAIYSFDRELKNLIFDYINILEINLKSYIVYEYIEKYGEDYLLKKENLDGSYQSRLKLDTLEKKVKENIERNSKNDSDIQKYLNNMEAIPSLILVKYFMFGNITTFYEIMKKEDKAKVAEHFEDTPFVVEKYFRMLNVVRNICAHGDILFDFTYGMSNLFSVMTVLKKLLDKEDFEDMFARIEDWLTYVKDEVDELSYHNLLNIMGFPKNYNNVMD